MPVNILDNRSEKSKHDPCITLGVVKPYRECLDIYTLGGSTHQYVAPPGGVCKRCVKSRTPSVRLQKATNIVVFYRKYAV